MQDERETVSRVLRGDSEAFRQIVERYQGPVLSFVRHLLLDREDALELAQEVFLTAFAKLSRFDPACSRLSTWLFTIAKNKTINANKKKRPRAISAFPEQESPSAASDGLVLGEMFVTLDVALRSLPDRQRRAFVLSQIEQLPYEEIAQTEGTRVGTIKSRVNRARQKLQASLATFMKDDNE